MRTQVPRSRRMDILPYLRRGDQIKIAVRVGCRAQTVSIVLNGRQAQNSDLAIDIIATAREFAQRNNPHNYRQQWPK